MNGTSKRFLRYLLFLLPLALATVGLMLAGETPLDAMFSGVIMYALNYDESPPNVVVQMARWTAPLATATGVALAFAPVVRFLRARYFYRTGDSVAVYGDEEIYEQLKKAPGVRAIRGETALLPAHRYVLFADEQENLHFYLTHRPVLEQREVYLRCSSLRSQELGGGRLHLYSMEEVGARLFWKQAELLQQFTRSGRELRIALVGFGRLGEQLLLWGLQNNIFSPDQHIAYDVFGPDEGFTRLHHELSSVSDPVRFHGDWREELPLLQQADRILVVEQEDQLLLVEELLFALNGTVLDVLAAQPEQLRLLEAQDRLRCFPWKEQALLPENLFDERTLKRAKAINLRYAHLYGGVEETAENAEREWLKLNSFTRYSNISAADYHEIRLQMLSARGLGTDPAALDPQTMELLARLEHIRWERFHYLNNWRHGEKVNGKAKNASLRTHSDLVPYESLSESEKEKDRENIRTLLQIR